MDGLRPGLTLDLLQSLDQLDRFPDGGFALIAVEGFHLAGHLAQPRLQTLCDKETSSKLHQIFGHGAISMK